MQKKQQPKKQQKQTNKQTNSMHAPSTLIKEALTTKDYYLM